MTSLSRIKPISYFKANAAEILADISETRREMVITQNGEARAVILDVTSYEGMKETIALLQLLMMGERDIEAGRTRSIEEVEREFEALRGRQH